MWEQVQLVFSQSVDRIEVAAATFLPGIVAGIAILAVGILFAGAVRWILARALARMGFDRRAQAWGLGQGALEGRPLSAPSEIAARAAFWIVVLFAVALGLDVFGASTTSALGLALLAFLPRLVVGAIIFLVGIAASRFLERSALIGAVNMQIRSARLVSLGVKWLVLVLGAAIALEHVGIGRPLVTIAFSLLFGGIVLALALALGLGSREAVSRALARRMRREDGARAAAGGDEPIRHV